MQNLLSEGKLLREDGNLSEAGYATSLIKEYRRKDIKANKFRIKEWDYYYIGNQKFGLALTIADNYYMGLGSISFLNFNSKYYKTNSVMTLMPKGKTKLPETSKIGDVKFQNKSLNLSFLNDGITRHLSGFMKNFEKGKDLSFDIKLTNFPKDSMVIATPFYQNKHFYYNQKINCMEASGFIKIADEEYQFNGDSYGVLDWGRGVWPYNNTWNWASLSSNIDGVKIGFNFGYGFGDCSRGTENMIFYNGQAFKVDRVLFTIPRDEKWCVDYLKPWKIVSNDKLVNLEFVPILDRYENTNAIILKSTAHQVFGKFSGTLVVNNQTILVHDLVGFAERVSNKW